MLRRRAVLRSGAVGAFSTAVLGLLPGVPALAAPVSAGGVVDLWYSAGGYGGNTAAGIAGINQLVQDLFVAKNKGIRVKVNGATGWNASGLYADMLSGNAPDVFEEYVELPTLARQGLLLNIRPYVQQANLDVTNNFLPGQLHAYEALNATGVQGLYALPAYVHQTAMAVNLGVLDDLGLSYPSENWDYLEAEHLWRKVAGRTSQGQQRLGSNFIWQPDGPNSFYMHGWGASYVDPTDRTRCVMDSAAGLQCANWLYGLINDNVCTNQYNPYGNGGGLFIQGLLVTQWTGTAGEIVGMASGLGGVKWRFYPTPAWPKGKFTKVADDFHAIWSGTKHPDQAWALLQFLSTDRSWQEGLIKLFLDAPALVSLWPTWVRMVEEFAPDLKGKNLEVFVTQVQEHMPMFRSYFAYETDAAFNIINEWSTKVLARQVSVDAGYHAAAQQVNAFEAAQKAASATTLSVSQVSTAVGTALRSGTALAAPSRTGRGNPPASLPSGYVQAGGKGAWTLVGDGADVWNSSANCVWAGGAVTAAKGVFSCRVTGLANATGPRLSQWAKIGLMAVGDLSDDAPGMAVELTGGNGVAMQVQTAAAVGWSSTGQYGGLPSGSAVKPFPANLLTQPVSAKTSQHLLRPVWLRLVRDGMSWTAWASLDGRSWSAVGVAQGVMTEGVWVGLFATAHNTSFDNKGTITASFDQVSGFTPGTFVQIGSP